MLKSEVTMNASDDKQAALIPAQPTTLAKARANSLAARGRNELRIKEEAEEWLRKGLALRDAAPSIPCGPLGPVNPYAARDPSEQLLKAADYVRQIEAGVSADIAAKNLRMTPEDEEFARTAAYFVPDMLTKIARETEEQKEIILKKRADMLSEAFQCFETGHKLGLMNSELLYWLADSYYWGCGVERDREVSAVLYRRAANQGHSNSQYCLGVLYSNGEGVDQDDVQAAAWLRKAAEQGNADAMVSLGLAFKTGIGVPQDYAKGAVWLRKAGEKEDWGDPVAS